MSIEKVRAAFAAQGIADRIRELDESSATVALAAQALGCEPGRIAKTLSFQGKEQPILVVAAGNGKIDNHRFKERFGVKAKMLASEEVPERIGPCRRRRLPVRRRAPKLLFPQDSVKNQNSRRILAYSHLEIV